MREKSRNELAWGGLAITFLILFYTIFSGRGLLKTRSLSAERDSIISQAKLLEAENQTLSEKRLSLREDMATIEKAARTELDMVGKDEILYKFTD